MTRLYAIAAAVVAVVFVGGLWFMTSGGSSDADKYAQCRTAAVAGGASKIGGPFTLVSETGETVTDADVIDMPTLLYFGYAFCPDVCPLDNARNAEAIEILEERGVMVKPVFISVDPQRDSPELLADFTANLHPRMLGLTGSPDQIRAASQAYRTYFKKQEPEEGNEDYYLIDHSTFSYLTFPDDGFVEFFRRDLSPNELADRIQCFVEAR